ncbi:hypothetical protein ACXPWS_28970 [Mycobacterium sp. BMJ-28]
MTLNSTAAARLDTWITRATAGFDRLIGIAILRLILGIAAVHFYVSDYGHREYLWGPNSYNSFADASQQLHGGHFSLYFVDSSDAWFNLVFHAGLLVAILFTIFGGRWLTLLHAVFLWSIYLRNQDILEGGDNLARILLVFMIFTVSNAYFAPGAKQRRDALIANPEGSLVARLLHNVAALAMLIQIAVLYFVAGYLKATAEIWTNGTAMYYISQIHQFSMFSWYPQAMSNVYLGWVINYFTIVAEVAVPFVIWSKRAAARKIVTVSLEGMHLGIMVCMGLVAFGLIMIGADSMILTDHDYQSVAARARKAVGGLRSRFTNTTVRSTVLAEDTTPMTADPAPTRPADERVGV